MLKKISSLLQKPFALHAVLVALYLITHLPYLTQLPVFADETIYIRWSQLIVSDPSQYIFFPLNDGKTPLFIWFLVPAVQLFSDPVYGARFISLLGGLVQVFAILYLVKVLGGSKKAQIFASLSVIFLPYWFFHHRIALMDGWVTVWGTLTAAFLIEGLQQKKNAFVYLLAAALSSAAAILTKVPAVLYFPALLPLLFLHPEKKWTDYAPQLKKTIVFFLTVGICIFPLKFAPAFSQIFSRGSDFLFSLSEFFQGSWLQSTASLPNYFWYYAAYCSIGLYVFCMYGLAARFKNKRAFILLLMSGFIFLAPIVVLGKVVYPRYLLPALPFFTAACALVFEDLYRQKEKLEKISKNKIGFILVFLLGITQFTTVSFDFMTRSFFATDTIPFVAADRVQYLTEWSSGHGIRDAVSYIQSQAETESVAVATEGYFGTLPDGILLYLFHKDVHNIWIEGIGQPVRGIPVAFRDKARTFDKTLLVVNSHRLQTNLIGSDLIAEYCRPYSAPCLQIWDITETVQQR